MTTFNDDSELFVKFAKSVLEPRFQVRHALARIDWGAHEGRYRDGMTGTVWGGSPTQDYCWVLVKGEVVETVKVGEEKTPTPWYVNGSFLRSIYRNP